MARWEGPLNKIDDYRWEIPQSYKSGMRVPGLIYADEEMVEAIREEQALEQVVNVAFLPGIVGYSLAMPDIHWGYGFPIGGVAATRIEDGVISPGGVGYDINCGVRLLRTNLREPEVRGKIEQLLSELFINVPSGIGSKGKLRVGRKEMDEILTRGARWAVKRGFGGEEDLEVTEQGGCLKGADSDKVSFKAKERGFPQSGTLGSGNHFLEVEVVKEIYEPAIAEVMGIEEVGQVLVMIHTGSRGLGHQVCDDYVRALREAARRYNIDLPDQELACAPVNSTEGQDYLAAMSCAANYAWTNRQCITHWVRECFVKVFGKSLPQIGLEMVYDVAHNIAKIESYEVKGKRLSLCVHRKGATRAFPAGHPDIPQRYREIGQPVLIPGDMGRCSYVAVGTERAMKESFGSVCHGAGRTKSRHAARRALRDADVARELASRGILVRAASKGGLSEEASEAYKDVTKVVEVCHQAGLCRKVVKAVPIGVVKG
ncbi:MAG TPA: RtcB family protein [Dehalococcoidia bacterium]|nr:RtcB family protein [Dehalococcoidia bacterium]